MAGKDFWSRVDQTGGPDACWMWQGHIDKDGYGRVCVNGKMRPAHTYALTLSSGVVKPAGLDTCHSCNVRACCNPTHLRFDTRASNVADAVRAGTAHRFLGKLSAVQIVEIRERRAAGSSQQDIADAFGLTNGMVSRIVRGKDHADLGGPIETQRRYVRHGG